MVNLSNPFDDPCPYSYRSPLARAPGKGWEGGGHPCAPHLRLCAHVVPSLPTRFSCPSHLIPHAPQDAPSIPLVGRCLVCCALINLRISNAHVNCGLLSLRMALPKAFLLFVLPCSDNHHILLEKMYLMTDILSYVITSMLYHYGKDEMNQGFFFSQKAVLLFMNVVRLRVNLIKSKTKAFTLKRVAFILQLVLQLYWVSH